MINIFHKFYSYTYKYFPNKFWENWAKTFDKDLWQRQIHIQHYWLLKRIKLLKPSSILEVGCGFGRNINFLISNDIKPDKISGIDISTTMICKSKKIINNNKVTLKVGNALNIPHKSKNFDLVFTHGLLMHINKNNIGKAIDEIYRVSGKYIIFIEQNYNGNSYTFVHNYRKLLKNKNFKIKEYKKDKKIGLDMILAKRI